MLHGILLDRAKYAIVVFCPVDRRCHHILEVWHLNTNQWFDRVVTKVRNERFLDHRSLPLERLDMRD